MMHTLPRVPNYEIVEPVKEIPGGYTARARSHIDNTEYCCVFIKYMDMSPSNYTRLLSLITSITEMRHSHICMIREYILDTTEKVLCIITEDYPTWSLSELVRGNIFLHTFEPWEIVKIGVAILEALEYLHNPFTTGGSLVHLGVSLDYIYITPDGIPKLSIIPLFWSLGLNELVNYSSEVSLYYSPQILTHSPFSTLADIWSLGVVLYFLLQGEIVFSQDNVSEVVFCTKFPVFNITGPQPLHKALLCMLSIQEESRITARELLHYEDFTSIDSSSPEKLFTLPFPHQPLGGSQTQLQNISSALSNNRLTNSKERLSAGNAKTSTSFLQEGQIRSNLIKAVVAGDFARFKELVSSESTLVDDMGRTALMYASFLGNKSMVKRLLKLESRRRDHQGCTALYYAAQGGHKGIVSVLLPMEQGIYCSRGLTAFNLLILEHHFQAAQLLLSAESPRRTELGLTALMVAAQENDIEAVEFLLKYESKQRDRYGWTALMYAIKSNSNYVINALIGAEESVFTSDNITPLMIAASVNNIPALTALIPLQSGRTDKQGRTALMYASMKGSADAMELLAQKTQELGVQDSMGFTSLMYAAVNNAVDLLPTLLSGERCKRDNSGKTSMIYAAAAGNLECVKMLLLSEAGAIDNEDYTALMRAIESGHKELVGVLLDSEAGILTMRGTALMVAAEIGDMQSVLQLIPYEAKMQRKSGECACMLALQANRLDVAKELLIHESHLHNKDGKNITYYAKTPEAKLLVANYRGSVNVEGTTKYVFN